MSEQIEIKLTIVDFSENYIRMCNKAVEIQDNWKPRHGDNLANYQSEWLDIDDNTKIREVSFKSHVMLGVDNVSITNRKLCVWLPRQDQLQEMAGKFPEYVVDWYQFTLENGHLESMEQLWLCFVMSQKFSKQWNGKDWIKS